MSFRLFLVSTCLVYASTAAAVNISGSSTTYLLITDRPSAGNNPVARMPLYENISLRFGDIMDSRLSLDGSARAWRDLKSNTVDSDDFRLYRAQLRWRDPSNGLDFGAGRQFVGEGVARTYLDGLLIKQRRSALTWSMFFGQPLRRGYEKLRSWDKTALQWGANTRFRISP